MKLPSPFIKDSELINVIIETPRSSGSKYAYDPETELFKLTGTLPSGITFPHHFGFIPHTKAEDGDPLDVLVFLNENAYPGCLMESRVIGIIEAEEHYDKRIVRNDRIVAVASEGHHYSQLKNLSDIDTYGRKELINFLLSYTQLTKKELKILACRDKKKAISLIKKHIHYDNS